MFSTFCGLHYPIQILASSDIQLAQWRFSLAFHDGTTKDDVSLKVYLFKLFAGAKATRKRKCCPQDCFFPLHSFKTIGFPDIFTYMCWVFHWNSHQSWSTQMSCEQWGWKPMAFFCGLCRKIGLRRTIRGIYAMGNTLSSSLFLPLLSSLSPFDNNGLFSTTLSRWKHPSV